MRVGLHADVDPSALAVLAEREAIAEHFIGMAAATDINMAKPPPVASDIEMQVLEYGGVEGDQQAPTLCGYGLEQLAVCWVKKSDSEQVKGVQMPPSTSFVCLPALLDFEVCAPSPILKMFC